MQATAPGGADGRCVTAVVTPWARLRRLPFVAWIILYCAVVWGTFGALLGAVAPNLRAQMGLSFDEIGWLMALWTSGGAIGSVLGGSVAKRFAAQRLLSAYATFVLLGVAGVMLAPGFATLALALVDSVAEPPRPRRATKPTWGSKQRRLEGKAVRSEVKAGRGKLRGEP